MRVSINLTVTSESKQLQIPNKDCCMGLDGRSMHGMKGRSMHGMKGRSMPGMKGRDMQGIKGRDMPGIRGGVCKA